LSAATTASEIDCQRFCRGVVPGGGRAFVCLAQNPRGLSQPCNAALKGNVPGYQGY
jgi:hypothetical protein